MALPLRDFSEGKGGGVITRNRIDLLAGLFVGLVGVIALIEAMNFELGSARRMGPGYFPFYIGIFMLILGAAIIFERRWSPAAEEAVSSGLSFKSILLVLAAVCCFALTIERFGLVPAVAIAVFLSTLADKTASMRQRLILTAVIPLVCVVIFRLGLELQVDILRWQP